MSIAFCPLNYIVQNNKYQNYKKNFFKLTIKGTFSSFLSYLSTITQKVTKEADDSIRTQTLWFLNNHTVNSARTTAHFN